ncbi:MAG: hypothetical protein O2854_05220 [Chloroflexi bacterium]|nr:hypothetical protein [Chloroflexota bacterium]
MRRLVAFVVAALVVALMSACSQEAAPTQTQAATTSTEVSQVVATATTVSAGTATRVVSATATATRVPAATVVPETEMTITVEVPSNTPAEDTVYLVSGPFVSIPMERIGENLWSLTLTEDDLGDPLGRDGVEYQGASYNAGTKVLEYAYSRAPGGWAYLAAEDIVDTPGVEFWARVRSLTFGPGTSKQDTVARWRWFPPEGEELPAYEPELTAWEPRLEGWEFMTGELVADLWFEGQEALVRPTHEWAKLMNVEWMAISPPWDYVAMEPWPVLGSEVEGLPSYTDEALRQHFLEAEEDGLKTVMMPQVCCAARPDFRNMPREWVEAFFEEYERFHVYHAKVAAETGAEMYMIGWDAADVLPSEFYHVIPQEELVQRWADLVNAVRAEFDGPVGYYLLQGYATGEWDVPWPWGDAKNIAHLLDFVGIAIWAGLAETNGDTQAQISANAEEMFVRGFDGVWEESGLPQILMSVAYGSFDGGAKGELGVFEVALETYFPEQDTALAWDGVEQAMVMQGVMEAVAKRPYVVGVFPFLYSFVSQPLSPDYSVRGKPAELLLARWYGLALGR